MRRRRRIFSWIILAGMLFTVGVACWSAYESARARKAEEAARRAFLARFGIPSDGTDEFVPLPAIVPHQGGAALIGGRLFSDRRLAASYQRTCAGCHWPNNGGTDGRLHGKILTRSSMNAVFADVFLHDASVTGLAATVARMMTDPAFCGGRAPDAVAADLSRDQRFATLFKANYSTGLAGSNVVDSIVQHLCTQLTAGGAFDRYLGGVDDALDARQKNGFAVFRDAKCASCHSGPALGTLKVYGGVKVPALRGLARRRLFMHDGTRDDLDAVLTFMPHAPQSSGPRQDLIAFLKCL